MVVCGWRERGERKGEGESADYLKHDLRVLRVQIFKITLDKSYRMRFNITSGRYTLIVPAFI